MKRIVLASASPRRAELLKQLGLQFDIISSNVSEDFPERPQKPVRLVEHLALIKAEQVASLIDDGLVIGADTIVGLGDRILEKPQNANEARDMLKMLSGREHSVYTGLALWDVPSGRHQVTYAETKVRFRELKPSEIEAYLATGEPFDKAGAYGIQGKGAALVEEIQGCYFNVVGLPISKLVTMLQDFGGSVW